LDRKRQSHAVLVLRTGTQDLVLDNLTNKIVPWNKTGYTFLRLQNPKQPSGWVSVLAGGIMPAS
jgi:predicted transglutaminase-like cysteine proteinase